MKCLNPSTKKKVLLRIVLLLIVILMSSCNIAEEPTVEPIHYYDVAGVGVSNNASVILNSLGYYTDIVYTEATARQMILKVAQYPANNSNDTVYTGYTYNQVLNYLDVYSLPKTIASSAVNSISSFCYYDVNGNLWMIAVEDTTTDSRSLKDSIMSLIPKAGYKQEKIVK